MVTELLEARFALDLVRKDIVDEVREQRFGDHLRSLLDLEASLSNTFRQVFEKHHAEQEQHHEEYRKKSVRRSAHQLRATNLAPFRRTSTPSGGVGR